MHSTAEAPTVAARLPEPRQEPDPYEQLRAERPELFTNPDGGIVILDGDQAAAAEAAVLDRGGRALSVRQSGVVYRDPYLTLLRDPVRFPDGTAGLYVRVVYPGPPGVAVLPLTRDGRVVLTEHFRHATRAWHLEIPRGYTDQTTDAGDGTGVDTVTATINSAVRELAEEIGAQAQELLPLGTLHPDTGILGGHVHLFAAVVDADQPLPVDIGEGIRRARVMPFGEAEDLVRDHAITDAFTVSALYRARLKGLAPR